MPIVARPRLRESAPIVVAKYARVSTLDQLDGFGLEDQEKISNGWLDRHPGATVHGEYVDEAVSGALESRPEMDRLVRDAHQRHFNRVLVPRVDRIGRTARAAYQLAWNMADLGVYVISVSENIDTSTESGWSQFVQHVRFSEMEWRRIRERTFAGRELKISYGGWPGGPAPYGYKIAQDTSVVGGRRKKFSVLVTDEHESKVLLVAAELIADGMNISEACDELNERKLYTRSGVPWGAANLRNRLHGETIHSGYVTYRKTGRRTGRNTTRCGEDGTPVHGDQVRIGVPPILSAERAERLMEALKRIGFQNGRIDDQVYPLSGRIDSLCGSVYTGAGRSREGTRSYRCKGMSTKGEPCGEPCFDAAEIEGAVWAELAGLMSDESRLQVMADEQVKSLPGDKEEYEKRVTDLAGRIAEHEDLIHRQVPAYMAAGVNPLVLKAGVREMQRELDEYRKQKGFTEEWLRAHAERERRVGDIACERLDSMTLTERKAIFDRFDIRVTPGAMESRARPGVKCQIRQWHHETGTLVPPDPTDQEWEAILAMLRTFLSGRSQKHFVSKYDIRGQFSGMLHRLRYGLSWADMPLTWGPINPMRERQLLWWKWGAWPEMMTAMGADRRGVEVYERPALPPLTVTGRLHAGLPVEAAGEASHCDRMP